MATQIKEEQLIEMYEDMLDSEKEIKIGQSTYSVSRLLKLVDSVAYRTGLADYADSLSKDGYEVEGY
jgi:hypothetical protein